MNVGTISKFTTMKVQVLLEVAKKTKNCRIAYCAVDFISLGTFIEILMEMPKLSMIFLIIITVLSCLYED